jgi:hypothetical protein
VAVSAVAAVAVGNECLDAVVWDLIRVWDGIESETVDEQGEVFAGQPKRDVHRFEREADAPVLRRQHSHSPRFRRQMHGPPFQQVSDLGADNRETRRGSADDYLQQPCGWFVAMKPHFSFDSLF